MALAARTRVERVVANRPQLPVGVGAERHPLLGLGLIAVRGERIGARKHELERPAELASGERGENLVRPDVALAAEAAAEKVVLDADPVRLEIERLPEHTA